MNDSYEILKKSKENPLVLNDDYRNKKHHTNNANLLT